MNDQSKMMMNLNQMNQSQMMMNPPQSQSQMMKMNPPQIINQSQSQLLSHTHNLGMNQQSQMKMMNQSLPPMMNRGYKVWSQQLPLDPNMKFQNPNLKPNFAKPGRSGNNNNNWKGKKVGGDKRKDIRRMEKPNQSNSSSMGSVGYQPPTLQELQSQNRLKARKFYPKKKFNARFAPFAPRNTTSFIIRAKKSGGIASLVSPCPVTPAVLPTPILSPSREMLGDMAKEEWGVDGYGSMKGLIRLRDVHDDEDEDGGDGSSESDVEEHVEVERRLDHDLSRFEMIYPNYGGGEYNNVLENRVDDQDSHIAQLEEENLTLRERLFLMERELGDLRRRMLFLERQNQNQVVEDVNEEVVENGSDNESDGGSDVPVMGIENNVEMVDSMLESERNVNIEANAAVKLDNDGVSEADGVEDVFMEESVPSEMVSNQGEIKGNEMGGGLVFDEVKGEKDEQKIELATQQCVADEASAKENHSVGQQESGENELIDRSDELKTQEAKNENANCLVSETDECKNQIVGTSSGTAGDDDLSVAE